MSLAYYARNAASADRARRRMRREGVTMRGDKLWTEEEKEIIRQFPDDNREIQKRLPHRTIPAIRSQRKKMGLTKKIHFWTAAEISKLRRLYATAFPEEIVAAFPHSTWINIRQAARYHGFRRKKPSYKPTGHAAIDQIREKCHEIKWSMADLDREARTKNYFARSRWYGKPLNYKAVGRALDILDGRMTIKWPNEVHR